VRRILCPLNLAPVLKHLGAAPIRRFPERTLRELMLELAELYGDVPVSTLFAPEALARVAGVGGARERGNGRPQV
jgi:hypothetical protein